MPVKLSFVIPAYNEELYLGDCLKSIITQAKETGIDCEIIVVNNASTDKTAEVARSFAGVIVVDEPKKGLAGARQAGFLASNGELIANVDADTRLTAGWIAKVVKYFEREPRLVALSGPHRFYDVSRLFNFWVKAFYFIAYIIYIFGRFILRIASTVQGGNFVVRRSALEKIGGYNPKFTFYGEDADLSKRLHKIGRVVFTFHLPIFASGRRLVKEGKFKIAYVYLMNYIWAVLFGRPYTKSATDVRSAPGQAK